MATLPTLANRWSVGLDALRALVRRDPNLSKLGVRLGAARVFTDAEVIRAAFLAKRPKLARAQPEGLNA